MSFASLGLSEALAGAVEAAGYTQPTPVQQRAIPAVLQGRDLMVAAQTGTGKTGGFALPVLEILFPGGHPDREHRHGPRQPRVLVLTPTRELAAQVHDSFKLYARDLPLKSAVIFGGVGMNPQVQAIAKGLDVLVACPGRLLDLANQKAVDLSHVEILVLDEADRMLDMGFAEDVQRLVGECDKRQQTLLFSATSGGAALREMSAAVLRDPLHLQLNRVSELNEGTRQQIITAENTEHKEKLVHWLLANETYKKAVIFTNTRVQADRLYGRLVAEGVKAFVLHGDKDQKDRKLAIDRVKEGGVKVLVATDVAARGLDIEGLDLVINFDMPRSGDEYVHRIGRTGRAGAEGLAISLICHNDWNLMSSIERYLKQRFERRVIKGLKGSYGGPKNLKASGKAAGTKKKKDDKKKTADKKVSAKPVAKRPKNAKREAPASSVVSQDGLAPLRRKKPAAE